MKYTRLRLKLLQFFHHPTSSIMKFYKHDCTLSTTVLLYKIYFLQRTFLAWDETICNEDNWVVLKTSISWEAYEKRGGRSILCHACHTAPLGGLEKTKVNNLMGAPSNPIPLVKRSPEQFLFLKLDIWNRARWESKLLENVSGQLYSYVKLNFKASLFSSTFWFERSFLAESAFLVSGFCTL